MDIITVSNGQATTTSLAVADKFGKRHKNVLQAIRNMECSESFRRLNFQPTIFDVPGPKGAVRREECFEITRDGFSFLAMGFTGKEAANWKEKFITAFNAMERALSSLKRPFERLRIYQAVRWFG